MNSEQKRIEAKDGTSIAYCLWEKNVQSVKAIIQIAHGMAEHINRYAPFAEFMNQNGIVIIGNDHRGHGDTAGSLENIGYFADEDGWNKVVDDMNTVRLEIEKKYAGVPLFFLGHSMGSLLLRDYIMRYGKGLKGVILSATAGSPGVLGKIGALIAEIVILTKGKKHRSDLLNQLSFGKFNQRFKPARTEFDWLSRDKNTVDKYIEDPRCGDKFMAGFYRDLLYGVQKINQQGNINQVPPELPVLFLSGEMDPVGDFIKGVKNVVHKFNKAGIKDVSEKFYPEGRHEMLNEINRDEVFQDILKWIQKRC